MTHFLHSYWVSNSGLEPDWRYNPWINRNRPIYLCRLFCLFWHCLIKIQQSDQALKNLILMIHQQKKPWAHLLLLNKIIILLHIQRSSKDKRTNNIVVGKLVKGKLYKAEKYTMEGFSRHLRKELNRVVGRVVGQKRYLMKF